MARILFVTNELGTWTATVDAERVTLAEAGTTLAVREAADGRFRIESGAGEIIATAARSGDTVWVGVAGHVLPFTVGAGAARPRSAARDHDALMPPMSATVVRILVRPGDQVEMGDTLVVLEAMKMELPIRAPRAATVRSVHCAEGELVQPGSVLVDLDNPP